MPPKMSMSQFVEPVSSKDFTGVIKLRILRWENYSVTWVSSKYNHKVPKSEPKGDLTTDNKGEGNEGNGSRDWGDVAPNQGMLSATGSWKRRGRFYRRAWGGSSALLTSCFQTSLCRTVGGSISLVTGLKVCGHLILQLQKN